MKKWKAEYVSMTARYNCGIYYADTKEEAERIARSENRGAFSESERRLIVCREAKD